MLVGALFHVDLAACLYAFNTVIALKTIKVLKSALITATSSQKLKKIFYRYLE